MIFVKFNWKAIKSLLKKKKYFFIKTINFLVYVLQINKSFEFTNYQ